MENKRFKLSFVAAFILLISSVAVYAIGVISGAQSKTNIIVYLLTLLMLCVLAYQSFREKEYPKAFEPKKNRYIADSALLAGGGFIIDFIGSSIALYYLFDAKRVNPAETGLYIGGIAFSILSTLYFAAIYLSYTGNAYDFRRLKILHFAPLLWAISKSGLLILNAVGFRNDAFSTIKGLLLIFAILFFFTFIVEIENEEGAKKSFVFFIGALSYLCLLILFIRYFDMRYNNTPLVGEDTFFTATSLCLFMFTHYLRTNLLSPTR